MLMPDCPCYDCRVRRGDTVDIQVSSETLAYEDRLGKVGRECGNEATGGQGFAPAGNEDEWDRGPRGASVAETLHRMEVARQAEVKSRAAARAVGVAEAMNGRRALLPTDPLLRKEVPMATGLIDYFPLALAAVAAVSRAGQKQHGTDGWDRSKSTDESDTLMRHFVERGTFDTDGQRHSAKVAWRALALLQKELEADR